MYTSKIFFTIENCEYSIWKEYKKVWNSDYLASILHIQFKVSSWVSSLMKIMYVQCNTLCIPNISLQRVQTPTNMYRNFIVSCLLLSVAIRVLMRNLAWVKIRVGMVYRWDLPYISRVYSSALLWTFVLCKRWRWMCCIAGSEQQVKISWLTNWEQKTYFMIRFCSSCWYSCSCILLWLRLLETTKDFYYFDAVDITLQAFIFMCCMQDGEMVTTIESNQHSQLQYKKVY